jgi:hypothetical protein
VKLRHIKRRHDARTLRWARLYKTFGFWWQEDDGLSECPEEDYAGCTACSSCGAGVNPHDEDECWLCGEEI